VLCILYNLSVVEDCYYFVPSLVPKPRSPWFLRCLLFNNCVKQAVFGPTVRAISMPYRGMGQMRISFMAIQATAREPSEERKEKQAAWTKYAHHLVAASKPGMSNVREAFKQMTRKLPQPVRGFRTMAPSTQLLAHVSRPPYLHRCNLSQFATQIPAHATRRCHVRARASGIDPPHFLIACNAIILQHAYHAPRLVIKGPHDGTRAMDVPL
jgi:hypothetical protein